MWFFFYRDEAFLKDENGTHRIRDDLTAEELTRCLRYDILHELCDSFDTTFHDFDRLRETLILELFRAWKRKYPHVSDEYEMFSREEAEAARLRLTKHRTPIWMQDLCILMLGPMEIKHIRGRKVAKNVVTVLDAFQEEGWPRRIDDPLSDGPNQQRLNETIRSLNEGLSVIHFRADGDGEGFIWERQ